MSMLVGVLGVVVVGVLGDQAPVYHSPPPYGPPPPAYPNNPPPPYHPKPVEHPEVSATASPQKIKHSFAL